MKMCGMHNLKRNHGKHQRTVHLLRVHVKLVGGCVGPSIGFEVACRGRKVTRLVQPGGGTRYVHNMGVFRFRVCI